jgi:NAD(P)-dependent dehydrogenase (short-subunit alcohol dehydrogenase family)
MVSNARSGLAMPAELRPSGRRVIVTGAGGGIGSAIVEALVAGGSAVAACDVAGTRFTFDVRDRDAVDRGVAAAVAELGGCDAVVANAGIVDTIHRAERFGDEEWRKDLETNLYGAFNVIQAAFEALAASGDGRVVVISSVAAEIGIPGQVAYGASKAGLVGMARTLAAEWASRGIRCNVVMPGLIATPKVLGMPAELREGLTAGVPLGRFGATAELAGAVCFLLSEAAAYITGAVLRVDGGLGLARGAFTR